MFIEEIKSLPYARMRATNNAKPTLASHAPNVRIIKVRKAFLPDPKKDEIIIKYSPRTMISRLKSAFNRCLR